MLIIPERPGDEVDIRDLTKAAFAPMPFADENDHLLPENLRKDGDLTLSLITLDADQIIGHVAFSPIKVDDRFDNWYGLGPISVAPERQKQGIGTQLVQAGRVALEPKGAKGFILIGNPAVYGPMGFVSDGAITYRDLAATLVQYLPFTPETPSGTVTFAAALEV